MKVSYFASMREAIGKGQETLSLPDNIKTIDQLINWLAGSGDAYHRAFADRAAINVALNETLVEQDAAIIDTDTLAIFPPMTGG